jgi:F-type H+-transporting ATPase subunit delta
MPRISVVAKNYAKALFLATKKADIVEKTLSELELFKQNFSVSFAHELKNPVISKNDLDKIIQDVADKFNLGKLTSNFFSSIVRNRRLHLFPEIYEEFARLVRMQKNILDVELIVVSKPEESQLNRIKSLIEKKYPDKNISIKIIKKEKILGGLQIKIGSEVIDASLQNQLNKLSKEFLSAIN